MTRFRFPDAAGRGAATRRDFLQQHLTRSNGDELIGRFARSHAALYATKDPLVDHVGFVSCFHEKSGAA